MLTALGIFTVDVEGMLAREANSEKHENANISRVNQDVVPVDEQYLQKNFGEVELPKNWRLIDFFDKYTGYDAISFWTVVALAKQFSSIDPNSFSDREKELILDVREFTRVRNRQRFGLYYSRTVATKKSAPTDLTSEITALFEHLVLEYSTNGQERLAVLSKKSGKLSRQDFEELINLAKEIGENINRNQQTSDGKKILDKVAKAMSEMPLKEEEIAEWFNKVFSDKLPFNGYKGVIFWTLAEIYKQFEGTFYAGMEEETLINRIKYYVENEFTYEEPTYYNIRRISACDLGECFGTLISRARRFFSDLVLRYGSVDDMKVVSELSKRQGRLCVDDFRKIVKLGRSIKKNIADRYERARQGDRINRAIGKIINGIDTGTATLVKVEGMPRTLEGRVLLTAGHCLAKSGDRKCLIGGIETYHRHYPNLSFDGVKICASYYIADGDIGIAILNEKIDDREVLIEENEIPSESILTLYSIGFGGFAILDNIEFGRKKATLKGEAKKIDDSFDSNCKFSTSRFLRIAGGDSGSPLIYKKGDGESEEIVGIVSNSPGGYIRSCWGPCLGKEEFAWIRNVCKVAIKEDLQNEKNREGSSQIINQSLTSF